MELKKKGSQQSTPGDPRYFTGDVRLETLSQPDAPARISVAAVSFEPGARSAWHTHPLGQTLFVTEGAGRVQKWGDAIKELERGDVVWTPPGEMHWHGASPTHGVTHLAIQERLDGKGVEWLEKVSDDEYQGK